jgi:hypothetical protein
MTNEERCIGFGEYHPSTLNITVCRGCDKGFRGHTPDQKVCDMCINVLTALRPVASLERLQRRPRGPVPQPDRAVV